METSPIPEAFIELGKRDQAKSLEQPLVPTECAQCHSKNLFAGGANVRCRDCGHIHVIRKRETTNLVDLPSLIDEAFEMQRDFIKQRRGR